MIESIISYDLDELESKQLLSEAKTLYQSKIIEKGQYDKIREVVKSNLYTPTLFIKTLLFILTIIGLSTLLVPVCFALGIVGENGYRIIAVFIGLILIGIIERYVINEKNHFKSGVTEAGIYTGFTFLTYGVLGFENQYEILYLIVGLIFTAIITVRYLDLLALVASFMFFAGILYKTVNFIGGITEACMPFIFMTMFLLVFGACIRIGKNTKSFVFENHLIIAKTLTLLFIYLSINYYVVRELSVKLLGFVLGNEKDIPFAIFFYLLTALIPLVYIFYGTIIRSVLFLRVGLLAFVLSVITFKYYFSLSMPAITFTVAGIILIGISLWLMNYLKIMRNGFTRDNLIKDNWLTDDVNAIIISQTMGGNKLMDKKIDTFGGGSSGGGGATSNW